MLGRWLQGLRSLAGRRAAEREHDEELRFHVEMETEANLARGFSPFEARRIALRDLGGVQQTREAVRDQRAIWLDGMARDLARALRRFRHDRGLAVAVVLTVGLAVGMATAVYSVAEAVLLRPLPYHRPDRLVSVWCRLEDVDFSPLAVTDLYDLREQATTLAGVAGAMPGEGFVLMAGAAADWVDAYRVTPNLFEVLGVRPLVGRTFRPDEEQRGRDHVAILSEPFWRHALGADPQIIGRRVLLKGESRGAAPAEAYEVVGVVPAGLEFFYPKRLQADLYVPRTVEDTDRTDEGRSWPAFITIARLGPGATAEGGAAQITAVLLASRRAHPGLPYSNTGVRVTPLHDEIVGRTRPTFLLLAAAAVVLVAIGSLNVANLLLVGGLRRSPEMATRLAIGCSRWQLFRQVMVEHAILAAGGGLLGVGLAALATPLLKRLAPATIPRVDSVAVDVPALGFALVVTFGVAAVAGLVPALIVSRPGGALRPFSMPATTGRGGRLRDLMIVGETSLLLALLGAASLVVTSVWRLSHVGLGFDPSSVLVGSLLVPERTGSPAARAELEGRLLQSVRGMAGVEEAGGGSELPFTWGVLDAVDIPPRDSTVRAVVAAVDAGYVPTLRIPLRGGRLLSGGDAGVRHVALVNETLARRLAGSGAVGQQVRIGGEWRQVVGIVGDVTEIGAVAGRVIRRAGLGRLTLPAAYVPLGTLDTRLTYVIARTALPPGEFFAGLRRRMRDLDPELALRRQGTLDDRVLSASAETRFCAAIVSVFALAALVLSVIGFYGVLAHAVGQRAREIGIRVALGAAPRHIRATVIGRAAALAGIGAAVGAGLWWASGRVVEQFLFEVAPADPRALGIAFAVLMLAGVAAAWPPVRRACRADTLTVLRCE